MPKRFSSAVGADPAGRLFTAALLSLLTLVAQGAGALERDEPWNPPRIVPLATGEALPAPEELERRGATIGRILIGIHDVFDLDDPRENNWVYRTANVLHIQTREATIRNQLIIVEGAPLVARELQECERILRGRRYLFDAVIRIALYDPETNVADIEVATRDVWTLNPGISYSQEGGTHKTSFSIEEYNLLGLGQKLQFEYKSDVDRTTEEIEWVNPHLFGSRWSVAARYADLSDGRTRFLELDRPFYALDVRWALGATGLDDQRVQTRYDLGEEVDAFRVGSRFLDLRYGWSKGLRGGRAMRWRAGLRYDEKEYSLEPGEAPPQELPDDRKFIYPWLGFEWIEDAYEKVRQRDQIGRTEDAYRGLYLAGALGYASSSAGSSHDALLFAVVASRAREYLPGREWVLSVSTDGRVESGDLLDTVVTAEARHYWHIDRRKTLFAKAIATVTEDLDLDRQLLLGAEEGLRGYPFRYQTGTASALATVEYRYFTDWYPFRLFHVGGAAFFDAGRTWGSTLSGTPPRGWLADIGIGLRLGNSRSGLSNVVHVDLSYALSAVPDESRFQVTIETRRGF
jgi:outer membrane protein assembly factor BamA